jgi:L-threonine kinase
MSLIVKSPGSCGELVQGTLAGQPFLITCPIDLYSEIHYVSPGFPTAVLGEKSLAVLTRVLAYLQAEYTVAQYQQKFPFQQRSALPVGKGMASSSADLSCLCQAVAISLGKTLSVDEIADLCLAIEPTDGTFYPEIMLFDHVAGKLRRRLGNPPQLFIAVFDAGGEVDTLSFNKRSDLSVLNKAKESQVKEATDLVMAGLSQQDATLLGQGATLSALANQSILYNPYLQAIIQIGTYYGACGVNAAHSGTVLGVLFTPATAHQIAACVAEVAVKCPRVNYLQTVRLISGGFIIAKGGNL